MSQGMLAWVYIGLFTVVVMVLLFFILRETFKQKMIAHRLESLAEDIRSFGRSSAIDELQRCDFCENSSHVHLWRYGNADVTNETFICYLCISRIQKHLAQPLPSPKGVHSNEIHYVQRDEQSVNRARSRKPFARR